MRRISPPFANLSRRTGVDYLLQQNGPPEPPELLEPSSLLRDASFSMLSLPQHGHLGFFRGQMDCIALNVELQSLHLYS